MGGFDTAAREYVVLLKDAEWTPAPWVNVIANPEFGCLVSTDGLGATWSINAQQNQLTPWSNDPVCNPPAEAVYIRDDDSGELWSPTPLPIREPGSSYVVRHGFGYSRFEHHSHDLSASSSNSCRCRAPSRSRASSSTNRSHAAPPAVGHSLCGMGARQSAQPHGALSSSRRSTRRPPRCSRAIPGAWILRTRVAFMDMGGRQHIGHRRSARSSSAAAARWPGPRRCRAAARLSKRSGGGLDPCGALQTSLTLDPGAADRARAVARARRRPGRRRSPASRAIAALDLDAVLKAVTDFWDQTLGAVQVKTPDRSMDMIVNGWLLYQTLACRLWARVGFYQASGAWGYRDQLQDVMALCGIRPEVAREHILRAAGRPVRGGRRAALVAARHRPGHQDTRLGRSHLAAVRGGALPGGDRGSGDTR